jgi:hypothetical protein
MRVVTTTALVIVVASVIAIGCRDTKEIQCGDQCPILEQEMRHDGCLAHLVWDPTGKATRIVADYEECGVYVPFTQFMTLRDMMLTAERFRPELLRPEVVASVRVVGPGGDAEDVASGQFFDHGWQRSKRASEVAELHVTTSRCGKPYRRQQVVYGAAQGTLLPMAGWYPGETVGEAVGALAVDGAGSIDPATEVVLLRRVVAASGAGYAKAASGPLGQLQNQPAQAYDVFVFPASAAGTALTVAGEAFGVDPEPAGIEMLPGECPVGIRQLPVADGSVVLVRRAREPLEQVDVREFCPKVEPGDVAVFPPRVLPVPCAL